MSFASMSHVAGYRAAKFTTMGSPAYNAPPRTLQCSINRPISKTPITTKKKTSPTTRETNVLPNATQSYPSPPAITTALFDPWKLIDQELENKIYDIYKKVINWKSRFRIRSKNKPGIQFIELLNQQLLSLVDETTNSYVAMKAAIILPQFTEAKALQIRHPKQKKSEVNEEV